MYWCDDPTLVGSQAFECCYSLEDGHQRTPFLIADIEFDPGEPRSQWPKLAAALEGRDAGVVDAEPGGNARHGLAVQTDCIDGESASRLAHHEVAPTSGAQLSY